MTRCDVSEEQGLQAADPWGGCEEQGLRREDFYLSILLLNTTWLNFILLENRSPAHVVQNLEVIRNRYVSASAYTYTYTRTVYVHPAMCAQRSFSLLPLPPVPLPPTPRVTTVVGFLISSQCFYKMQTVRVEASQFSYFLRQKHTVYRHSSTLPPNKPIVSRKYHKAKWIRYT